jgi:hypothetical protein
MGKDVCSTVNEEISGGSGTDEEEELSQQSSDRSNKQNDINFPGLLSSSLVEPFTSNLPEED